jgi:tRNA G18 (ribose-2'-O)-methylase SpoU
MPRPPGEDHAGRVEPELIDDPNDARIADYVGLRDSDLRVSVEAAGQTDGAPHGRFIVEGALAVERLVDSPYPIRSVLISDRRIPAAAGMLSRLALGVPRYVAPQEVLNAVAGFNLHRGVVASAARLATPGPDAVLGDAKRILVVEGVVDHENIGSLFRNGAAFGVDAVVLDATCADPFYRRAVRVSMGHVLRIPIARSESLSQTIEAMQGSGWTVVALTPSPSAIPLEDLPVSHPHWHTRVAVLVGSEGPGLSQAALDAANWHARISMSEGVDSLNVATAAAIAMHHLRP